MKISKRARRDAKGLFRGCRVNGLLDEQRVRQTVQMIVGQKPRGYLGILAHLERLVKFDIERRAARVESAVPLTAAQQGQVAANLTRRYGPGLNIAYSQNPSLLGGMRIKVGSDVYDGSIDSRLQALANQF